eukprot:539707-Amphidinium_carterae.1
MPGQTSADSLAGTLSEPCHNSMVLASFAKPSLSRHTGRISSTKSRSSAATTVLRPDSMVSFSRWNSRFTSVAKLGSSNRQSATN